MSRVAAPKVWVPPEDPVVLSEVSLTASGPLRHGYAEASVSKTRTVKSPIGEMMASVLATFAQFERRLIGQRTKDALAVKRAQGVRLGAPQRGNARGS